jgi:hypothetical protein
MKHQLTKSINKSFERSIQLITDICESEIEKIFLLKIIDHILKRPDRYSLSFILVETDTKTINGIEVTTSKANFQMPDDFGYLCGVRMNNFISQTFVEIFPQKQVEFENPDNILHTINYRLDFGVYKYNNIDPKTIIKKYCIECDGFEFHNTKEQLKKDNERMRNLLLRHNYTTLRYLGTEIHNWDDSGVGTFIWNL